MGSSFGENQISRDACSYIIIILCCIFIGMRQMFREFLFLLLYIRPGVCPCPRPRNNVYFASTYLKRSKKYSPGVPSFVRFYYIIICVLTTTTTVCLISKTSGGKYLETCRGVRGYLINLKGHHTTSTLRGGVTMFII